MNSHRINSIFEFYGWTQKKNTIRKNNSNSLDYIYIKHEYPNDEFKIEDYIATEPTISVIVSVPMPRSDYSYKNKLNLMTINIEDYIEQHLKNYNEKMCL